MPYATPDPPTFGSESTVSSVANSSTLSTRPRTAKSDHRRSTSRINWPESGNALKNTRTATLNSARLSNAETVAPSDKSNYKVLDPIPTTKKRKGVLNFLAIKEPSSLALQEYAEAQRRLALEKGGRNEIAGISSQKLPGYVPKVNSKWDGLPATSTHRPKTAGSDGKKRYSTLSASTGRSHKSVVSSASNFLRPVSRSDHGLYHHSRSSSVALPIPLTSEAAELDDDALSLHELATSLIHPALRMDGDRSRTFLNPPTPPAHLQTFYQASVAVPLSELETPDTPYLHELNAGADAGFPHELPPVTAPEADGEPELTPATDLSLGTTPSQSTARGPDTFLNSDTDPEDLPAVPLRSPNRPSSINFSRPMRRRTSRRPSPLDLHEKESVTNKNQILEEVYLSSTLKNSDGHIDPFLTDTFAAHSMATGRITEKIPTPPPAASNARALSAGRTLSNDSHVTTLSSTTAASHPTLTSPTFSAGPSESTRPSSAGSDTPSEASNSNHEHRQRATPLSPTIMRSNSTASSHAPSVAGSEMSARWRLSSKERLGLGSKMKKGYVASPWDVSEHLTSDNAEVVVMGGRGSPAPFVTMNLTVGEAKRKRLSFKIGGKR